MKRKQFLLIILLGLLVACAPTTSEPAMEEPEDMTPDNINQLADTTWTLAGYGDSTDLTPPVADSQVTLIFDDDRASGNASCNQYGGSYILDGSQLTFSKISITEMACLDENLMIQENEYITLLTTAESFQVELATADGTETLTLTSDAGTLVFRTLASLALDSNEWQLSGIASPVTEAVVSTAVDASITLTFDDGNLSGNAGCNRLMASYEVDEDTLSINPIATTKMLCDEERNQREAEFLAALDQVTGHTTTHNSLTLTDAGGKMLLSFRPAVK